jgi:hypothetical protein
LNILNVAGDEKIATQEAAIRMAEKRIEDMGRIRMSR